MNFLGHIYFSNNQIELMYANIFGDFIKGKDLSNFPQFVQEGIRLHRTIDDYIDHHPTIVELTHKLYKELPKVAGIAVDLYFDYFLAKNWNKYHSSGYLEFINAFHNADVNRNNYNNRDFWFVIDKMKEGEWLKHSKSMYGLKKASQGVSNMISFDNVLNQAPKIYTINEEQIDNALSLFIDDAIPFFEKYFKENISS